MPLELETAIAASTKIASAGADRERRAEAALRNVELRALAEVGDHEQEHDHHRAGVHQHLRRRDEVGLQHEVQHRQGREVQDQRERREERVALRDDPIAEPSATAPAM